MDIFLSEREFFLWTHSHRSPVPNQMCLCVIFMAKTKNDSIIRLLRENGRHQSWTMDDIQRSLIFTTHRFRTPKKKGKIVGEKKWFEDFVAWCVAMDSFVHIGLVNTTSSGAEPWAGQLSLLPNESNFDSLKSHFISFFLSIDLSSLRFAICVYPFTCWYRSFNELISFWMGPLLLEFLASPFCHSHN